MSDLYFNAISRGFGASRDMALSAGRYDRSTAALALEAVASVLSAGLADDSFAKFHDTQRDKKERAFVQVASPILRALDGLNPDVHAPIVVSTAVGKFFLSVMDSGLVFEGEGEKEWRFFPNKDYACLKMELANELCKCAERYEAADVALAKLIAFETNFKQDGRDWSEVAAAPPRADLGTRDAWNEIAGNLSVEDRLSLGLVNMGLRAFTADWNEQARLSSAASNMIRWTPMGTELVGKILALPTDKRLEPLRSLLVASKKMSAPDVQSTLNAIVEMLPKLSQRGQSEILCELADRRNSPVSTALLVTYIEKLPQQYRVDAMVAIARSLRRKERDQMVTCDELLAAVSRLSITYQGPPLAELAKAVFSLPEDRRAEVLDAIFTLVSRFEISQRAKPLGLIIEGVRLVQQDAAQPMFDRLFVSIGPLDLACQGLPLAALIRASTKQSLHMEPQRRETFFKAGVALLPELSDADSTSSLLQALAISAGTLAENLRKEAFCIVFEASRAVDVNCCKDVMSEICGIIPSLPIAERKGTFDSVVERLAALTPDIRQGPLAKLAYSVIKTLPAEDRLPAFKTVIDSLNAHTREDAKNVLGDLIRQLSCIPLADIPTACSRIVQELEGLGESIGGNSDLAFEIRPYVQRFLMMH